MPRRSDLRDRILNTAAADRNATHAQIAKRVGCHVSTVSRHLRGRRAASAALPSLEPDVNASLRGEPSAAGLLGPVRTFADLDNKVALLSQTREALTRTAQGEQTLIAFEAICGFVESGSIDRQTACNYLDTLTGWNDRDLMGLTVAALRHSHTRVAAVADRLTQALGEPYQPLGHFIDHYNHSRRRTR